MEVPFVAWIEEIPRSATLDDVSKPWPNITPSGYNFHGLFLVFVSRLTRGSDGVQEARDHLPICQLKHSLKERGSPGQPAPVILKSRC
jgi:hypothetical protein